MSIQPLTRDQIVTATVEEVLALYGIEPSSTGSGFARIRRVVGAHAQVDVQEGFSPRGTWLSSKYTDENVAAVNELNTFGLFLVRDGSRDLHPDSGMGMAHVSYQLAYRAFANSADFMILLTPDMLDQMGKTDAEVFTPAALRTGLTIDRVMKGLKAMPGQTLPVWTGEHCGHTLDDSRFHRDLVISRLTHVTVKGAWYQVPWEENFSMVKSAAAEIVVPADGTLPYINGSSTGFHEYLTQQANAMGLQRVEVVTVSGDDSEYCDEATVHDLIALEYKVIAAYEAMAPLDRDAEALAFRRMKDAGALLASNAVLREANKIYEQLA